MKPARRHCYTVPLARGDTLTLGERTLVMGVLNVTPDSFSDGGRYLDADLAAARALELEAEGADLLDIGGETTRPGADPVDAAEEGRRILPVLARLRGRLRVPISVDTYKAEVADAALRAGASLVNDISGLQYDPPLAAVVAGHGAGLVLMHMRGRSRDMYRDADYDDVVARVAVELGQAVRRATAAGVPRDSLLLDPGLGFAKRAEHSWRVLAALDAAPLAALDRPWLVGASRKSFLAAAIGDVPPADRDWATAAAVTAAILGGAHVVRVHRVAEMRQVARVADRLLAER
ncbi:MAG: dihydropteroate synthase [Vicinamibacterales bacterium]|nr:dihydropteroate synthase [Vicinamibacterales bacterium]